MVAAFFTGPIREGGGTQRVTGGARGLSGRHFFHTSEGLKKFQSLFIFCAETLSLQKPPRMV